MKVLYLLPVADCYCYTSDTQAPRQHIQLIPFQLYNISYGVRNDKESKEYKEYLRLSKQRGDTEYHKEIASPPPFVDFFGGPRSFFDYDPVKIDITSNADFDEEHKAGTSLADITLIHTYSPYHYIKNNYMGNEWTLPEKPLSEATADDVVLIFKHNSCHATNTNIANYYTQPFSEYYKNPYLTFEKLPTADRTHLFTITLINKWGRELVTRINVDFGEEE